MHTQSFRKKIFPILIPSSGHDVSVQSLFQCPVITSVSSPYIIHTVITSVSSHYVSILSLHTVITSVSSHYIQSLHQCPVSTSASSHYISVQSLHQCPVIISVCSPPPLLDRSGVVITLVTGVVITLVTIPSLATKVEWSRRQCPNKTQTHPITVIIIYGK